jgi:lysophospholipase L1-like esterase
MTSDFMPGGYRPNSNRRLWYFAGGLLVVILAVTVAVYVVIRPKSADGAGKVIGPTQAPPATSTTSSPRAAKLKVVILRGGLTGCLTTGGCNSQNYADHLAYKLGWDITVDAHGATGYIAGSIQSPPVNFAGRLDTVYKAKPNVVLIEGSVNDAKYPAAQVRRAAIADFTALHKNLPSAKIIVVGPAWGGDTPPDTLTAVEQALKTATAGRVSLFIDPIADKWFAGPNAKFMAADHESPTDQGHSLIATNIAKDVAVLRLGPASLSSSTASTSSTP